MNKEEKKEEEEKKIPSAASKRAAVTVLNKICYLQTKEPDSLLGVEDQIRQIQRQLQRRIGQYIDDDDERDRIYELEDVIDELLFWSAQTTNRVALIRRLSFLVDLPKELFYVLAGVDLIHHYKLRTLLEHEKFQFSPLIRKELKPRPHGEKKDDRKKEEPSPEPKSPPPGKDEAKKPKPLPLAKVEEKKKDDPTYIRCWIWTRQSSFPRLNLKLGSTIIDPVNRKLQVLSCHKKLSPSMRKQSRWLRDEIACLEDLLPEFDSRRLSEEELAWIDELCDVCRSAENVVGLFIYEQQLAEMKKEKFFKNMVWSPNNLISQRKLSQQMSHFIDKICSISNSRRFLQRIPRNASFGQSQSQRRSLPACIPQQLDIISFDEEVDAMTATLLKDDLRCLTIFIVGVRGTGKTSIAKLIYENKPIAALFPHRIWVSGQSTENIRKKILGVEDSDLGHRTYQDQVRQKAIFVEKKYLIVVDDACQSGIQDVLYADAFRNLSNGTRIIFTCRDLWEIPLANYGNTFIHKLLLRSNEKSWSLFTHILGKKIPQNLEENLKKNILRKCGGLPEMIVKLGKQLSQVTLDEWPKVLEQLIQDEEPWSEILQTINGCLPLYLRRCLFHFGLFPVDFKIPARRLIALWVAEGLRHADCPVSPEYIAEWCLKELVSCNVVQIIEKKRNYKIKTCCLPEALRIHWFSKAKQTNNKIGVTRYLTDHLDQNDAIFNYIHGKNTAPPFHYRDIISFLSFDTREPKSGEDVGNFLDRCFSCNCFRFLWMLDLERVYKPKLPKEVDRLTQLRYLGLRWTYIDVLPMSIGKLLNLQTLDLKETCINNIPSSIWMMSNLRNLLLDEKFHSMLNPRPDNASLVNLETLRGVCIDEESPVRNGLDTLLKITKLGLKCRLSVPSKKLEMSSQLIHVANWVMNLKYLQYLKLKSLDEKGMPWNLKLDSLSGHLLLSSIYLAGKLENQQLLSEFPENLVDLTLSSSGLEDDPMQKLSKLPKLRIVRLLSRSFVGKKMLCSSG